MGWVWGGGVHSPRNTQESAFGFSETGWFSPVCDRDRIRSNLLLQPAKGKQGGDKGGVLRGPYWEGRPAIRPLVEGFLGNKSFINVHFQQNFIQVVCTSLPNLKNMFFH